jgi:hydro-lyases, Fe-S type, tartrate/fumarate subfamily, beta region
VSEEDIRKLVVGDAVELTGRMITGRDAAHKWLVESFREEVADYLKGTMIYQCGPVVRKNPDGSYDFVAAGPTTSIREEPYEADVICRYGLRGVIGKGGMGPKTAEGLKRCGAVYLHAVGGAAQVLAHAVKKVERVFMLEEFGVPEAMWVIHVEKFPVMVTMDSHGRSLHTEVEAASRAKLQELLGLEA